MSHPPAHKTSNEGIAPSTEDGERGDEVCSICLEKIETGDDESLPCSHSFHRECIGRWNEVERTCPVCRRRVGDEESVLTQVNGGTDATARRLDYEAKVASCFVVFFGLLPYVFFSTSDNLILGVTSLVSTRLGWRSTCLLPMTVISYLTMMKLMRTMTCHSAYVCRVLFIDFLLSFLTATSIFHLVRLRMRMAQHHIESL